MGGGGGVLVGDANGESWSAAQGHSSHLSCLEIALSNERIRLAAAKSDLDHARRRVWVAQLEREIAAERAFLNLPADAAPEEPMTDAELLGKLGLS